MRQTDVKKSLIDQLKQQGKETPYTLAIVEDYMLHYRAVQQLWKDVRKRGVKVTGYNAKGQEIIKDNESLTTIQKEQVIMLKMLQTLKLQDPVKAMEQDDYL